MIKPYTCYLVLILRSSLQAVLLSTCSSVAFGWGGGPDLFFPSALLGGVVGGVAALRCRVVLRPDGIRVVNPVRTHFIKADEIVAIRRGKIFTGLIGPLRVGSIEFGMEGGGSHVAVASAGIDLLAEERQTPIVDKLVDWRNAYAPAARILLREYDRP